MFHEMSLPSRTDAVMHHGLGGVSTTDALADPTVATESIMKRIRNGLAEQ